MSTKQDNNIIQDLKNSSLEAFESGHYVQSAIIIFQTVESQLQILVSGIARGKGIEDMIIKKISEDEKSFHKLILNLNLLQPENKLLQRLYSYGNVRNHIVHNLFEKFNTVEEFEKELMDFCMEGVALNKELFNQMGLKD